MRFKRAFGADRFCLAWRLVAAWSATAWITTTWISAVVPPSAEADEPAAKVNLETVLRGFRSMPGLYARFREEKKLSMLTMPLTTRGEIYFAPPGQLLRRVTDPDPSRTVISEGRLSWNDRGKVRHVDLSERNPVGGFVNSLRYVLAGDEKSLTRDYQVTFRVVNEGWRLQLRPKTKALRRFLQELVLQGTGHRVSLMVLREANGDETRTTFHDVDSRRRFSNREKRELFRVR